MLRIIVLALVLANGLYGAWTQGWLLSLGWGPVQQREPYHLAQQIKPEALRLLSAQEAQQVEQAARAPVKPTECLQAGVFDEAQATALRTALAALPAEAWQLAPVTQAAHWIVYMGKYPNAEALAKKRSELASLKLTFEPLTNPALELGLSLGGFDTQAAANDALAALGRRGVRTARVVQERGEESGLQLRLPAVDDALRARLEALKPAMAGKALRACR